VIPLQSLLEDEHLAVLLEPEDAFASDPAATRFDPEQRDRLCRELVDDHRIDEDIARPLTRALAVAPAATCWPDSTGVVALADSVAARFCLDRSAALCLAVAVTRRLGRTGLRPVSIV